jgi:hypothetical protein
MPVAYWLPRPEGDQKNFFKVFYCPQACIGVCRCTPSLTSTLLTILIPLAFSSIVYFNCRSRREVTEVEKLNCLFIGWCWT